jgi:hypothetical protein
MIARRDVIARMVSILATWEDIVMRVLKGRNR